MSRYNVIQAIYKSFYSPDLYRDVGENWGGKAFFYLFFLLALSWIGQTWVIQSNINHIYDQGSELVVSQIPVVSIKEGVLSTPENKPYVIKDPDESDKVFAIIDTSGQYKADGPFDASVLVTSTEVVTKPRSNETRTYKLPEKLNVAIDPKIVNEKIQNLIGFAWIPIFIFLLFASYIYRIIQVMLYSIIGKLFSLISGSNVSYGRILQITMVALTPTIVLATVLDITGYTYPRETLSYFVLSMLYMFFGIIANRKSSGK